MKSEQQSIVLVNCFFGALPPWMNAFLLSCSYNKSIFWHIFSDRPKPNGCPSNVLWDQISVSEFNERASSKLGFSAEIRPEFAYKLCDFKPFYGLIFDDFLKEYDFWGNCDLDIIWGDLRRFLTARSLRNAEIITARRRKMAGHLTVYRTAARIHEQFLALPNIRELLQDGDYQRFDEVRLTRHFREREGNRAKRLLLHCLPQTLRPKPRIEWEAEWTTGARVQMDLPTTPRRCFSWQSGRTFDGYGKELAYIHFHYLKTKMKRFDVDGLQNCQKIVVDENGIVAESWSG